MAKTGINVDLSTVIDWVFKWIEKHSVIVDSKGNIIEDSFIGIGDKKLSDFINLKIEEAKGKYIDEYYKDWCGKHHTENSCHPVHDSSECTDFAEYVINELSKLK